MSQAFKPPPCLVPLKGQLKTFVKNNQVISDIVEHLKSIPEIQSLKKSLQFLEYVGNLVENTMSKSTQESKVDSVIKIYSVIFDDYSPLDIPDIKIQLEYILSNNLIKKIPLSSKFFSFFKKGLPSM